MLQQPPLIDHIPNQATPAFETIQGPWYKSRRTTIFLLTFLPALAISLFYTFARPPIFQSKASLLTLTDSEIDLPIGDSKALRIDLEANSGDANLQHVETQRLRLAGSRLLQQTVEKLKSSGSITPETPLTVADVRNMLKVKSIPDTNLVELIAEGSDPEILPQIVNTWIDIYRTTRADESQQTTGKTILALQEKTATLEEKVLQKRKQLDIFRQSHDILSVGRDENLVLARLKGLTESLNKAEEQEVSSRAALDAARNAIANGKPVVPEEDKRSLANLEQRAQELRETIAALEKQYTPQYLALQPQHNVLPQQLAALENEIQSKLEYGKQVVLSDAQREYDAAHQAVAEIHQQLTKHKQKSIGFTTSFNEHEALQQELTQLEELFRNAKDQLTRIELKQQSQPQVKVIERAYFSDHPVHPQYQRDAATSFAGSLLLGLLAIWMIEFLGGRKKQPAGITLSGVHMYPTQETQLIPITTPPSSRPELEKKSTVLLEQPLQRECTTAEIQRLLDHSDLKTKQLIGVLLSGLSLNEAAALTSEQINFKEGTFEIKGTTTRTIPISELLKKLLLQTQPTPLWQSDPALDPVELDALIHCAAIDAGLIEPDQIVCNTLHNTYILFLVRQGIRLSELQFIVGALPPSTLSKYGQDSPSGPGKSIQDIETTFPGLATHY